MNSQIHFLLAVWIVLISGKVSFVQECNIPNCLLATRKGCCGSQVNIFTRPLCLHFHSVPWPLFSLNSLACIFTRSLELRWKLILYHLQKLQKNANTNEGGQVQTRSTVDFVSLSFLDRLTSWCSTTPKLEGFGTNVLKSMFQGN